MLVIFLVALIAAWAVWLLSCPFRSGLWKIPGPWWRQFTDLFQALDAAHGRSTRVLQECHAKYGNLVRLGPKTVSISDPGMIALVYGIRSNLPKSHHWKVWETQLNGKLVPSILYTQETKAHGLLKRPIAGIYSMSNITKSEPFLDSSIMELIKKLDEDFISGPNKGRSITIDSWMHYFGYDAVMNMTLSMDFGFMRDGGDTQGIFSGLNTALLYRATVFTMPWIHSLVANSPLKKIFAKRIMAFQKRAQHLIQTRMAEGRPDSSREDLLFQFLETQKAHPQVVDDLVLNGYVVLPLLAGADTVSIVLSTIVYNLGRCPGVAAKLHAELKASGISLPPKFAEIQQLPYLGAVIREALRIHPIMAFVSRRVVPAGNGLVLADGRVLPPGTVVAISPWVTHFNREVYGSDAETFNPDRWLQALNESEAQYEKRLSDMNRADLSWGYGDRACIGKNIAKCEIYKLIATLYLLFDITLVEPGKDWKVEETLLTKQTGINVRMSWKQNANLASLERLL